MSEPIGRGDYVQCIDASPAVDGEPVPLVYGAIYLVLNVFEAPDANWDIDTGLQLAGIEGDAVLDMAGRSFTLVVYSARRFRPISRKSDGERFIASLSTPVSELETV